MDNKDLCLFCKRPAHKNIILINKEIVCSYCPKWLIETEARELLAMPKAKRIEELRKRELKRGNVDELKKSMTDIFNQRKPNEKT